MPGAVTTSLVTALVKLELACKNDALAYEPALVAFVAAVFACKKAALA